MSPTKKKEKIYHLITFYTPVISPVDYDLSFSGITARIIDIGDDFYFLTAFFMDRSGKLNAFNMYIPYTNIAGMAELKESSEKFEPEEEKDSGKEEFTGNVINLDRRREEEKNE